jgi:hypothetical protein
MDRQSTDNLEMIQKMEQLLVFLRGDYVRLGHLSMDEDGQLRAFVNAMEEVRGVLTGGGSEDGLPAAFRVIEAAIRMGGWLWDVLKEHREDSCRESEKLCVSIMVYIRALQDALKIFESIHDLISQFDERLRASQEVYIPVRKCFDMLYEYIGKGEKTEKSYHGVHEDENWKLRDSVKEQYETIIQDISKKLQRACVTYHRLRTRLLFYESYCAFMDTYSMCRNMRGMEAYPTETEEKYIPLAMDEKKWTEFCENMDIVSDVDKTYFKSQLKNNTELKGSVIKLAICKRQKLDIYKRFMAVEGVYEAIDDVLDILQSHYIYTRKAPRTHAQMDREAERYLKFELQKYDTNTPNQDIEKICISREDKKKLMVDLISSVYDLCKLKSLQRSAQTEYKNFWEVVEVIYKKVLYKNMNGVTSLNYSPSEQLTTELERLLDESYGIFLKMRKKYLNLGQRTFYQSLESDVVFLNTVMNRLDDGKEWHAHVLKDGCWEMIGRDGAWQRITVEHPMMKVTYTSKEEKYCFVRSYMRKLERQCQSTYELILVEDIDFRVVFQSFHSHVSVMVKEHTKMLELWKPTYDNWLKIEPEVQDTYDRWLKVEPEKREDLLMHEKHLLNIGVAVHFLESIVIDLTKVDFEWIIRFKLGDLLLKWTKKDRTCVVCLEREREVVLHPCRHYCLCIECSNSLSKCPICRRRIEDTVDFATVITEDQPYFLSTQFPESGGYTRRLLMELETLGMSI